MDYYSMPEDFSLDEIAEERFRLFLMGLVSSFITAPNSGRIEQTVYEDMARILVGPEAYLVFVFDRLISAVSAPFLTRVDPQVTALVQQLGGVHSEPELVQAEPARTPVPAPI